MHTRTYIILAAGLIVAMAASESQAQTRDWKFLRDTVYEGSSDSLRVVQSGSDSLRFDSVAMELIKPTATYYQAWFSAGPGLSPGTCHLVYNQGTVTREMFNPAKVNVAPHDTVRWFGFNVEGRSSIVAKRAAINQGDSLAVRLIFIAAANRGRDTLIVLGKQDLPVGIRPSREVFAPLASDSRLFDLRGRKVEKVPEGAKVPRMPLVSPKE